jgi:SAM-dependent methyltransferase
MAITCPVSLDKAELRSEITSMYSRVASDPDSNFHFHRGPQYAAEFLGYDAAELALLPAECTASFAGVGNPLAIGPLAAGESVLDIGCGAGMDLLLAGRRVGRKGLAVGVDMTEAMRQRARAAAAAAGLSQVEVRAGDATNLPVSDASMDVVISNGVLTLVPEKDKAVAEIMRVLRPGGRTQFADIIVEAELSEEMRSDIDLWTG